MAVRLPVNTESAFTLATTCTLLTPVWPAHKRRLHGDPKPRTLVVYSSTTGVYIVTGVADGAALPTEGRRDIGTVTAGSPLEFDITPYDTILLAGAASGTARIEIRS